jgi:hypothetical protein
MSNDKDQITEHTNLLCGRKVPTSLYKSVRERVVKRYSELEFGKPYKLKKICGEPYWSGLGNQNTNAGLIMADLVDRQLVPYFFISERDEKPLWYCLKP